MQLHWARQWGACWLACELYEQLQLDRFWATRLPDSREGTSWRHILQTLVHAVFALIAAVAKPALVSLILRRIAFEIGTRQIIEQDVEFGPKQVLPALSEMAEKRLLGDRLDTPRQIVSKWRKRFYTARLSGLEDRPRDGRASAFFPRCHCRGQSVGL
jgi:hypothetical protein